MSEDEISDVAVDILDDIEQEAYKRANGSVPDQIGIMSSLQLQLAWEVKQLLEARGE